MLCYVMLIPIQRITDVFALNFFLIHEIYALSIREIYYSKWWISQSRYLLFFKLELTDILTSAIHCASSMYDARKLVSLVILGAVIKECWCVGDVQACIYTH